MTGTENGAGNETTTATTAQSGEQGETGSESKVTFTAEQQAEMNRVVAKERRAAEARGKAEATQAASDAAEQARKDAATKDAKDRGEFEKVEATLRTDLQAAKDTSTSLQAKVDQYQAAVDAVLTADWDGLDADVLEYFEGDADDPLARLNWLPKGKKLQAQLHPDSTNTANPGNPANPRLTSTSGKPTAQQTLEEMRRNRGLPAR